MTLDYNFEATFWSAATANHADSLRAYTRAIFKSRLLPLARARAAQKDWSPGGWPDRLGAAVMGMSCGPTPDWDHDYGCSPGFGSFKGIAFVSCTGPDPGMECAFDDGTRWVAGLVATPLLQYYDATGDPVFLESVLVPYLREVADFYTSYASWNDTTRVFDLLWTCAQEICQASEGHAEHNSHQDLAYARMTYARLLEFTRPGSEHGVYANGSERMIWQHMLENLAPFPIVLTDDGTTIFAEAITYAPKQPAPTSNLAFFMTHTAAIFPAGVVDAGSNLRDTAWATALFLNTATDFAPGNGFCIAWPPLAALTTRSDARAVLRNFTRAYERTVEPNGWPSLGGGGLEQISGTQALHLLMLRPVQGVLHIFPAWPITNTTVSFANLRAPGAFSVSAAWDGDHVRAPVRIESLAGRTLVVQSPFEGAALCVTTANGRRVRVENGPVRDSWTWKTQAGTEYDLQPCG